MKKIEVNENKYDEAKLLLLALAVILLPAGVNMLMIADLENWFSVVQGLIIIVVGIVFMLIYRMLKVQQE